LGDWKRIRPVKNLSLISRDQRFSEQAEEEIQGEPADSWKTAFRTMAMVSQVTGARYARTVTMATKRRRVMTLLLMTSLSAYGAGVTTTSTATPSATVTGLIR